DLEAPLLGANVVEAGTDTPYHKPYEIITRTIDGQEVTVGVLGLVTPGVRIWDKAVVDGELEFKDMVETAKQHVPEVAAQADVVVVLAHTGLGTVSDADYVAADLNEDVAKNIAYQVPDIDVIVSGHTHLDKPSTIIENVAGDQVLVTQPNYWAQSVSEVTLNLVPNAADGFDVDWSAKAPVVAPHYARDVTTESPAVVAALADEHQATIDYVNTPVAESVAELPATTSRYEDTAIIDFINNVQAETVDAALEGTAYADIPVISEASPFSRTALFPKGEVTIRDIAGLYIYENTLRGVQLSGAELKDYLEFSARYFTQVAEGTVFDPATGTNAVYSATPNGVPDYNYDALSGVDYTINVSKDVGSRIETLTYSDGSPIAADDQFILAVNNYRQSGGGGFPHVAAAPVVYDERQEIRQLLIDWAGNLGTIDPADFFDANWALVTASVEAEPTPEPTPDPTPGAGTGAQPGSATGTPAALRLQLLRALCHCGAFLGGETAR
ncbi:MAG: bifunctional metallophosphatase/5-nucleotidase, partial [Microbacteriaceae bacterium]|nr:bifunctional metallophosphatase/5-nucleotidase [Microbacteriaceae bacterium]